VVPASLPLVTRALLGGLVWKACQREYGEAEKARQRWIVRSVHRGPREIGRKTIVCGTPGELPAFAVTTSFALFSFVQTAVGDGILPASPPPSICAQSSVERNSHVRIVSLLVIAGLDPAIHDESQQVLAVRMDHRVKPGDDEIK